MCMFININKYTFSYVTFLIVKKKKEGGEHVLLSRYCFLTKILKNENLLEMYFISPFFSNSSVQEETLVRHVYRSCNCS